MEPASPCATSSQVSRADNRPALTTRMPPIAKAGRDVRLQLMLEGPCALRLLNREMHARRAAAHQAEATEVPWWEFSWRTELHRLTRRDRSAQQANQDWLEDQPEAIVGFTRQLLGVVHDRTRPGPDTTHPFHPELIARQTPDVVTERVLRAARQAVFTVAHPSGPRDRPELVAGDVPEVAALLTTKFVKDWLISRVELWETVRQEPAELYNLQDTDCPRCSAACRRQQALHPRSGITVTATFHSRRRHGQKIAHVLARPSHQNHPDPVPADSAFGLGIGQACYQLLAQSNPCYRFAASTLKPHGTAVRAALHRRDPWRFQYSRCDWCADHLPCAVDPDTSAWLLASPRHFVGHL